VKTVYEATALYRVLERDLHQRSTSGRLALRPPHSSFLPRHSPFPFSSSLAKPEAETSFYLFYWRRTENMSMTPFTLAGTR